MDRSVQHAFDVEEIMAYLDGELEPQRAAALAAHLVGCGECQEVAKSFRAVSERILSLEIEPSPTNMSDVVRKALSEIDFSERPALNKASSKSRAWRARLGKPLTWSVACLSVAALLLIVGLPSLHRSPNTAYKNWLNTGVATLQQSEESQPTQDQLKSAHTEAFDMPAPAPPATIGGDIQAPEAVGPMIAQTASLSIVATNYDEASTRIERLAAARGGYVEKMDAKAQTGSARELSAALRIPGKQLDGFLADLRKLGHVEEESRGNEEVSAQYVDLQARLKAARATEQRLTELLGTRTGKLSDVLEAERELARVRGEIESMQGQNAVLVHRVSYATVQVEVSEVYREQLTVDSKGTKIRNALVEGLSNVEDGAVSLLLFVLAFGPAILFWLAVLLVPAWLVWRRFRRRTQR
jgi:Domain of unknown function (DUF4349)/Putative zinc-finger